MLYFILIPLCTILVTLLFLRVWTVAFTDHPITNTETVLRSFVKGFKEGYNGTQEEIPTAYQPSPNAGEYQALTLEEAEMMAEKLVADAWSEAKVASRQSRL